MLILSRAWESLHFTFIIHFSTCLNYVPYSRKWYNILWLYSGIIKSICVMQEQISTSIPFIDKGKSFHIELKNVDCVKAMLIYSLRKKLTFITYCIDFHAYPPPGKYSLMGKNRGKQIQVQNLFKNFQVSLILFFHSFICSFNR